MKVSEVKSRSEFEFHGFYPLRCHLTYSLPRTELILSAFACHLLYLSNIAVEYFCCTAIMLYVLYSARLKFKPRPSSSQYEHSRICHSRFPPFQPQGEPSPTSCLY